MATIDSKKLEESISELKDMFAVNKCVYPAKLNDMLTNEPDFNSRANFDECLEAELFKVLPHLEVRAATTARYPRWPIALENVLRIKYPDQSSLGEHEQLYSVTLWHPEQLDKLKSSWTN